MSDLINRLLQKGITEDQKQQVDETQKYLEQHNIQLIFEELLGKIILSRSNDPRKIILEGLKNIKEKNEQSPIFNSSDFEAIFEAYDCFETKTVKHQYLIMGLELIGLQKKIEDLHYEFLKERDFVYQNEFIEILTKEYETQFNKQ